MSAPGPAMNRTRWIRLSAAVGAMMLTSIYQYSWFLFSFEIQKNWGWSLASLGLIYSIFHYTSTLVMPFSGLVADTYGPRLVALGASLLVGAGFILCALFPHLWAFQLFFGLGGIGCGGLYGVSLGGVFFGESMFSVERDASKVALAELVRAMIERNGRLIDCQVASAHLESLGARSIPRQQFVRELAAGIPDVQSDDR